MSRIISARATYIAKIKLNFHKVWAEKPPIFYYKASFEINYYRENSVMFKKKKKKEYLDDDGRTVSNMNVDGMPWYDPNKDEKEERKKKMEALKITRKEKRAMICGAYLAYLPMFLIAAAAFTIVMLLISLWLS